MNGAYLNSDSDVDGDGYKDLVIGAVRDDINSTTHLDSHYNSMNPLIIKRYKKTSIRCIFCIQRRPQRLAATPPLLLSTTDAQVNRLTGGLDINGDGFDLIAE